MENLESLTKTERFNVVLNYVTNLKNETSKDVMKKALLGNQDNEVISWNEAFYISELCAKGFISAKQSDALIDLI